jgi:hypothetical protein
MNKMTHAQHHGGQNREGRHPPGPNWKRLHHHWYFWVAMFLMLAAIVIYVMTEDLAWVPQNQSQQPLSGAGETYSTTQ